MAAEFQFKLTSRLSVKPPVVWNAISTMQGVNAELWPLMRMTVPAGMENMTLNTFPLGQPAFKSRILFLGLIPIDVHELTLLRVKPNREFYEHSRSTLMRHWKHERVIEPKMTGCEITDEIRFEPKIRMLGYLLYWPYRLVFWNRHRNLRRRFKE